ncbi:aerotaxis receptor [Kineosphaera limosa]|nr:PAS domain-containing protein [Kineosphaera limosa]NYE00423.1 aerotaxis receptor [Kineosphaera limosa]
MKAHDAVTPTDIEHAVGVDDYLFSTTDRQGVIEEANSVFVRLSRYPHEQLLGAPHNIVRHPEMPGGAFKLVWEQLEAGRPACAYVRNMAADGGTYWVFATLLPVGDKYLSVRMKPLVSELLEGAAKLYQQVRPVELGAREHDGASRDEAAAQGLQRLAAGLAPLGITSADDLALLCLPAEVSAHEQQGHGLPWRPEATGPLAELLTVMHAVDERTGDLVAQLAEYDALVSALEASSADAGPATDRLNRLILAARAGAEVGEVPELLPEFTARMSGHAGAAAQQLAVLRDTLRELARDVRWLRMRIALLRLHNRMVGTFCAELIDDTSTLDAVASLRILCQALREGAAELDTSMAAVRVAMTRVPELVQSAVRDADRTLRLATKWRAEAATASEHVTTMLEPHLSLLLSQSANGFDELRRFYETAARCSLLPDTYDAHALREQIERMQGVLASMSQPEPVG